MSVGILAIALLVVVPHLVGSTTGISAQPGVGTAAAQTSGTPDVGVCLPQSARCDPANPPVTSGFALWQEAVFIVGLVVVSIVGSRRIRRSKALANLPRGVHTMIHRPPRTRLISL
jgi:hypothetical protein